MSQVDIEHYLLSQRTKLIFTDEKPKPTSEVEKMLLAARSQIIVGLVKEQTAEEVLRREVVGRFGM